MRPSYLGLGLLKAYQAQLVAGPVIRMDHSSNLPPLVQSDLSFKKKGKEKKKEQRKLKVL